MKLYICCNTHNLIWYRFLGDGVFSIIDYDTWKPRRQLYDPAFRKRYDFLCMHDMMLCSCLCG